MAPSSQQPLPDRPLYGRGRFGEQLRRAVRRAPATGLALSVLLLLGAALPLAGIGAEPRPKHQPVPASTQTPEMFRIVGCRSSGSNAYLSGPSRKQVAIGFDDGPAPDTPAFVTMLERSHAQATFFMIGEQVSSTYRATLLRELRNGDVLGDHTFTHPELTRSREVRSQLQRTIGVIDAVSGYSPCIFRPPYGAYNTEVVRTARSLGLATVLWNVDPSDYTQPGAATIVSRVLAQVRPGSIVISHDGGGPRGQTLAAYPTIISSLRARGYQIVTIPQLLGFRPIYVPCIRLCDGVGVTRLELPRGAIVERAP
ncbi:MAG TPA: polysaccharide deacetylase family protein [Solirubrobacteraceae bacterium]|nr:polysaccharide deacetylase family protein [Solirubrobacteraceae bacterium]